MSDEIRMKRKSIGRESSKIRATSSASAKARVRRDDDRRTDRRLELHMPIEVAGEEHAPVRAVTQNICTGGFYVELERCEFEPGEEVRIAMTVPAEAGVSMAPAKAQCRGSIARIVKIRRSSKKVERIGVAIRFLDRLRFAV